MKEKSSVIIACSMLKDELEHAMAKKEARHDIVWMDKGLHEYPQKLNRALQEQIDAHQDRERIMLGFCLCGNATLGLVSPQAELVMPAFHDCIRMLMAHTPGQKPEIDARSLYYTRGWLNSERFILADYEGYKIKYGEKKADYIIRTMLGEYKRLKLIDDGCYKLSDCMEQARQAAVALGLEFEAVQGTNRVLKDFVQGSFGREIVVVRPGEAVGTEHFGF